MSGPFVPRSLRMRPAALPFTDPFTRSDGAVEDTTHPWYTPVNSLGQRLEIVSNKIKLPVGGQFTDSYLDPASLLLDITVTMTAGTSDNQLIVFRNDPTIRADPTQMYLFAWSNSTHTYSLIYRNSGIDTAPYTSAVGAMTAGSNYTVRLVITATRIALIIDSTLIYHEALQFTPTTTQTVFNLVLKDTSGAFDDLTVIDGTSSFFYDDFNRANGAPSNGFFATYGTVLQIVSNACSSAGSAGGDLARDFGQKDFDITFDYVRSSTSNNLFLTFRGNTTGNASLFYLQANGSTATFVITQRDRPIPGGALTDTTVYSGAGPGEATGTWRFRVVGTAFQAWRNGTLVATVTLPADKPNQANVLGIDGLRPASTGVTVDNYLSVRP